MILYSQIGGRLVSMSWTIENSDNKFCKCSGITSAELQ